MGKPVSRDEVPSRAPRRQINVARRRGTVSLTLLILVIGVVMLGDGTPARSVIPNPIKLSDAAA